MAMVSATSRRMVQRGISKVVEGIEQSEGAGARVRRSIGNMSVRNFNPFLMFDHFKLNGPNGFPEHPHSGQETITYCLQGLIAHEDLMGNKGMLYPGDLQFMTAGKGIVHLEMPVEPKDGLGAQLLQLWVDLPAKLKECEPRYRDLREWEIPVAHSEDGLTEVKVISGKLFGVESVKDLAYTPVEFLHFILKKGASFKQELNPDFSYFLYNIKGNGLTLNGSKKIKQYENVFFANDGGDYITGEATGDDEFILVGGQRLDQPVVQHGPFVQTLRDKIIKKFTDYQYARGGFEKVRDWQTLISGGVTEDMINGPLGGNLEEREKAKQAYLKSHA